MNKFKQFLSNLKQIKNWLSIISKYNYDTINKALQKDEIKATIGTSLHNRFDIEVVRDGEVIQRAYAENIICNALWTRLLTPNTYFNYIHYGTGNGTPAITDTQLFTFLNYGTPATADDVYTYNWDEGWVSLKRKIQLAPDTAVGSTLTEVGIGYNTTASTLCTHALLKDVNGDQISITKTDIDIVNIYATVFVHWNPSGYDNGYIKIFHFYKNPLLVNYLTGISIDNIPSYLKAAQEVHLSGDSEGTYPIYPLTKGLTKTYSIPDKKITFSATKLSVSEGNAKAGISCLTLVSAGSANFNYMPAIYCKTGGTWFNTSSIVGEPIGTGDGATKDFSTKFNLPINATIYIDGVAQSSGVTVENIPVFDSTHPVNPFFVWDFSKNDYNGTDVYSDTRNIININGGYMSGLNPISGKYAYYYNPYYSYGVSTVTGYRYMLYASDDLITWVAVASYTGSTPVSNSIPEAYRYYRYWKTENCGAYTGVIQSIFTYNQSGNIHFDVPPASGTVITADYDCECIAKDANHVFDFSLEIQLGDGS